MMQISEKDVDYYEVMNCRGRDVTEEDIERLKLLEEALVYPPRLRFQFVCHNKDHAQECTKVEVTLNGSYTELNKSLADNDIFFLGSTPLLKHKIFLKRPGCDFNTSFLSVKSNETSATEVHYRKFYVMTMIHFFMAQNRTQFYLIHCQLYQLCLRNSNMVKSGLLLD